MRSMVVGAFLTRYRWWRAPSTMLRMVPLPVNGEDQAAFTAGPSDPAKPCPMDRLAVPAGRARAPACARRWMLQASTVTTPRLI
jgi:hypothetical protein